MNQLIAQLRSLLNLDSLNVIESRIAIQRFLCKHAKDNKMFGLVTYGNPVMLYASVNSIAYVGGEMIVTFNRLKPSGEFLCYVNFSLNQIARIYEFSGDGKEVKRSSSLDLRSLWQGSLPRIGGVLC